MACKEIRLQTLVLFGVLAMTLAVFAGVRGHEFVHYDDAANIYDNPHVASLDGASLQWMFTDTDYARRYMPLGWLCYALSRQAFGLNPRAFHFMNLGWHLLNVVMLFFLVKTLVLRARNRLGDAGEDGVAIGCAGISALFWGIHPLRVEVVAWASAQIYGIVFLLVIVWILAWLKAQTPGLSPWRRRAWHGLSVTAYAVSLLTYPLALFAPVALFALEVFPLRRAGLRWSDWFARRALPIWRDKVPFLAVTVCFLALVIVARAVPDQRYRPVTLAEVGLFPRVMQAFYVWAYYVWKPWAPYDLAPVYPTLHAFHPLDAGFVVSATAVLGTTVVLFALRRRIPGLLVLWICHLVMLVPMLGLSEYPHCAADRYSYVQGILWSVGIAFLLRALWERRERALLAGSVVAAASVIFGALAWQQVGVWRDSIPLYERMVSRMGDHPSGSRWDEALGVHYLRAGMTNAALDRFTNAVACEERRADRRIWDIGIEPRSHQRMGDIFISMDKTSEAADHYRASLEARPTVTLVVLKYATALSRLDRDAEAIGPLQKALEREPGNPALHHQLALCLRKLGRNEEADSQLKEEQRLQGGKLAER